MNSEDRSRTLWKKHKNGKIGYWTGYVTPGDFGAWLVTMEFASGPHDAKQVSTELITEGKQGRSVYEQAVFRLNSRTKNKLDSGYVTSYDQAKNSDHISDAQGRVKPMLAQKFKDYRKKLDPFDTYVQLKYNGHRCLIMNDGGRILALSRNGKEIPGIPHILENMSLEPGQILDGEVYCHNWKLQEIASAAKKLQRASYELKYIAYDMVDTEHSFSSRLRMLQKLHEENQAAKEQFIVAPTILLGSKSLTDLLHKSIERGFEGLILRPDGTPYEIGRRSSSLLKVKTVEDSEFEIVDIIKSKDNWGILICKLPSGGTFKVSAPGTIQNKVKILECKDEYIGQMVTVEYSELTQDGVPFHPVAIGFRNDL
jgi:ATP-dependent DNA ligase